MAFDALAELGPRFGEVTDGFAALELLGARFSAESAPDFAAFGAALAELAPLSGLPNECHSPELGVAPREANEPERALDGGAILPPEPGRE